MSKTVEHTKDCFYVVKANVTNCCPQTKAEYYSDEFQLLLDGDKVAFDIGGFEGGGLSIEY